MPARGACQADQSGQLGAALVYQHHRQPPGCCCCRCWRVGAAQGQLNLQRPLLSPSRHRHSASNNRHISLQCRQCRARRTVAILLSGKQAHASMGRQHGAECSTAAGCRMPCVTPSHLCAAGLLRHHTHCCYDDVLAGNIACCAAAGRARRMCSAVGRRCSLRIAASFPRLQLQVEHIARPAGWRKPRPQFHGHLHVQQARVQLARVQQARQ